MGRKKRSDDRQFVPIVRSIISYLCVIALFGSVTLIVHASLMEKKIRYLMTDRIFEKMELLDEKRKVNNQIAELESYQRISGLIEERLPHLGPPRYPAIEISVQGLRSNAATLDHPPLNLEDEGWMEQFRRRWNQVEEELKEGLKTLVD